MNKKIKENRYKPEPGLNTPDRSESRLDIDFCLKCIMTVAAISLISLASIFIYDFITQSSVFNVKKIDIKGIGRAGRQEILTLAELKTGDNIFKPNLFSVEKKISNHPWILTASVKRQLPSGIVISVVEQQPLAIVKIENLADILINTRGLPFKEYNPKTDQVSDLPVITGLDLTSKNNRYRFQGPLFNSIMDFLSRPVIGQVIKINGDNNTGLKIQARDVFHPKTEDETDTLEIKLGFNDFQAKLYRAKQISEYIDKHFPERVITSMDLFNIEKVFIKTKRNDALHNTLEKGV